MDLPKRSGTKVKIICDVCGKEAEICYGDFVGYNEENKLITCASNSCKHKKYEDTCTKKYGVNNPNKAQEIQDKKKDTNLKRYGVENVAKSKIIQNRMKATLNEKYGTSDSRPHTSQIIFTFTPDPFGKSNTLTSIKSPHFSNSYPFSLKCLQFGPLVLTLIVCGNINPIIIIILLFYIF